MSLNLALHPSQQNFLLGHKEQISLFSKHDRLDGLPRIWLFHGQKGIGKATLAFQTAKVIFKHFYQNQLEDNIINRQVSCLSFPNLKYIQEEEGKLKIEQARQIVDFQNLRPVLNGPRVVIVDSFEKATTQAQNSLLKTLERKDSMDFIFFITSNLYQVLPTIRSRCAKLPFQKIRWEEASPYIQSADASALWTGSLGDFKMLQEKEPKNLLSTIIQRFNNFALGQYQIATPIKTEHPEVLIQVLDIFFNLFTSDILSYKQGQEFKYFSATTIQSLLPEKWVQNYEKAFNLYLDGKHANLNPDDLVNGTLLLLTERS